MLNRLSKSLALVAGLVFASFTAHAHHTESGMSAFYGGGKHFTDRNVWEMDKLNRYFSGAWIVPHQQRVPGGGGPDHSDHGIYNVWMQYTIQGTAYIGSPTFTTSNGGTLAANVREGKISRVILYFNVGSSSSQWVKIIDSAPLESPIVDQPTEPTSTFNATLETPTVREGSAIHVQTSINVPRTDQYSHLLSVKAVDPGDYGISTSRAAKVGESCYPSTQGVDVEGRTRYASYRYWPNWGDYNHGTRASVITCWDRVNDSNERVYIKVSSVRRNFNRTTRRWTESGSGGLSPSASVGGDVVKVGSNWMILRATLNNDGPVPEEVVGRIGHMATGKITDNIVDRTEAAGPQLTPWISGGFYTEDDGVVDMAAADAHLGLDSRNEHGFLYGVGFSRFNFGGEHEESETDTRTQLSVLYPYLAKRFGPVDAWVSAGMGSGKLTLEMGGHEPSGGLEYVMFGSGLSYDVLPSDRHDLRLRASAVYSRTQSDEMSYDGGVVNESDIEGYQFRIGAKYSVRLGDWKPYTDVSIQYRGGDVNLGTLYAAGAGIDWSPSPATSVGIGGQFATSGRDHLNYGGTVRARYNVGAEATDGVTASIEIGDNKAHHVLEGLEVDAHSALNLSVGYRMGAWTPHAVAERERYGLGLQYQPDPSNSAKVVGYGDAVMLRGTLHW